MELKIVTGPKFPAASGNSCVRLFGSETWDMSSRELHSSRVIFELKYDGNKVVYLVIISLLRMLEYENE